MIKINKQQSLICISESGMEAEISFNKCFRITSFCNTFSKKNIGLQDTYLLSFDRQIINLAVSESCNTEIKSLSKDNANEELVISLTVPLDKGQLFIEKHIFVYHGIPAIRMYDIFSSDTNIDGIQYSDILSFNLDNMPNLKCANYFSCTDQSNNRLIETLNPVGKINGSFILAWENQDDAVFFYREGPCPDNQPVHEEYNFIIDKNNISCVGLGFNKIRKGEARRTNGIVFGLAGNTDSLPLLRYYQNNRYRVKELPNEILANSWPAFHTEVDETKIKKELELAPECGIDTVFIDDGWFSDFMGEIDTQKFPNDFTLLSKLASEKGINIGLWMNPFGLSPAHPKAVIWDGAECNDALTTKINWNWVARSNDFRPVDIAPRGDKVSYYAMDIMNPEYYSYIKNRIVSFYTKYGIRRFKFDLYHLDVFDTLLGDQHQHFETYRKLIEELKNDIPELVISMDITRRSRPSFDFALDTGRLFMENRDRKNHSPSDHRYYHPWITLRNFFNTAKYVPAQKIEVEIIPQIDDYPLEYILGTAVFATPLYWGALTELSKEKKLFMYNFFERLKPHRNIIHNSLIMTSGDTPDKGNWTIIFSCEKNLCDEHTKSNKIYIGIYRNGATSLQYRAKIEALKNISSVFYDVLRPEDKFEMKDGVMEISIREKFGFRLLTNCSI